MDLTFFEAILNNMTDGVYILDDKGNYIFVNSAYIELLNMPKSTLLQYNVHDFLSTGQINTCISDIVYREKRQVVMFQDVYDTQSYGRKTIRQMIISTPIFNSSGNVQNILAVIRPLDLLNALYHEAGRNSEAASASMVMDSGEKHPDIIAESCAMRKVLKLADTVLNVDTAILITGESGTGKEVIAQYIHRQGNRKDKQLVVVNCASLPANLLEAELFGYEKGAFTGASANGKKGLFEEADGGIIFLDEINSLPLELQGKLLRAIETKSVKRVGATKTVPVDFRLMAASNEDLETLVEQKLFRLDLLYRLNVIPIAIPPLKERKEDIIPLATHFLSYFCEKHSKQKVFSPATLQNMVDYHWPGNVRQLKNFVERSVVVSLEEVIEIENVDGITGSSYPQIVNTSLSTGDKSSYSPVYEMQFSQLLSQGISLEEYVDQCEKEYLSYVFKEHPNTYKAAEILGTSQTSVMRRKKKYKL